MSEELGLAAAGLDEVVKEISRVDAIARGDTPGIISIQYTREKLQQLREEASKAESMGDRSPGDARVVAHVAYTQAALRDAEYGCRGRKYMRTLGLMGKARAAAGRMLAYAAIEDGIKEG